MTATKNVQRFPSLSTANFSQLHFLEVMIYNIVFYEGLCCSIINSVKLSATLGWNISSILRSFAMSCIV